MEWLNKAQDKVVYYEIGSQWDSEISVKLSTCGWF